MRQFVDQVPFAQTGSSEHLTKENDRSTGFLNYQLYKPESNEVRESCKTLILGKLKRLALFLTDGLYRSEQSVFADLYRLHNHC